MVLTVFLHGRVISSFPALMKVLLTGETSCRLSIVCFQIHCQELQMPALGRTSKLLRHSACVLCARIDSDAYALCPASTLWSVQSARHSVEEFARSAVKRSARACMTKMISSPTGLSRCLISLQLYLQLRDWWFQ